jgi:hypothetical protein
MLDLDQDLREMSFSEQDRQGKQKLLKVGSHEKFEKGPKRSGLISLAESFKLNENDLSDRSMLSPDNKGNTLNDLSLVEHDQRIAQLGKAIQQVYDGQHSKAKESLLSLLEYFSHKKEEKKVATVFKFLGDCCLQENVDPI